MNFLSLCALIAVTLAMLVSGLRARSGVIQYPFLAAAVCGGWFIPQAIGLMDDVTLPEGGYALTMFYAAACMCAIWIGYKPRAVQQGTMQDFDENRLLIAAAGMSVIGGAAYLQILNTPAQQNELGLTTGIVTVYFFFSKLQYFGLALALLLLLKSSSKPALALVLVDLFINMSIVLFGGRRGAAVELAMIIMASLWFQQRIVLPRAAVLAMVLFASIFGNSIGSYRQTVEEINTYRTGDQEARLPSIEEILEIPVIEDFSIILEQGSYEARNAVYTISAASEARHFNFGIQYWNHLIFSYVPAQFVGRDLKEALTFKQPDLPLQKFGYISQLGTTTTGFADSFAAFWIFGVMVFFAISRLLSRWWSRAIAGSMSSQFLYAITIATAMQSITHGTHWLISFLPYSLGVYWAVSKWAVRGNRTKEPANGFRRLAQRPREKL